MYEFTAIANSTLSEWVAKPVLVVKNDIDLDLQAKPRLTVNYSYVIKDLPRIEILLLAEIHDCLLDPYIGSFSQFDLKYAYWAVLVDLAF